METERQSTNNQRWCDSELIVAKSAMRDGGYVKVCTTRPHLSAAFHKHWIQSNRVVERALLGYGWVESKWGWGSSNKDVLLWAEKVKVWGLKWSPGSGLVEEEGLCVDGVFVGLWRTAVGIRRKVVLWREFGCCWWVFDVRVEKMTVSGLCGGGFQAMCKDGEGGRRICGGRSEIGCARWRVMVLRLSLGNSEGLSAIVKWAAVEDGGWFLGWIGRERKMNGERGARLGLVSGVLLWGRRRTTVGMMVAGARGWRVWRRKVMMVEGGSRGFLLLVSVGGYEGGRWEWRLFNFLFLLRAVGVSFSFVF